jgi:hypothetical protein
VDGDAVDVLAEAKDRQLTSTSMSGVSLSRGGHLDRGQNAVMTGGITTTIVSHSRASITRVTMPNGLMFLPLL